MNIDKKDVPNSFKEGDICIGHTTIKGKEQKVFFNPDPTCDTGLVVIGKQGSGKGVYLENYINDCIKKK